MVFCSNGASAPLTTATNSPPWKVWKANQSASAQVVLSGLWNSPQQHITHTTCTPPLRAALPHSKGNLGTTFFVPPHQSLDEVMHLVREVRGSAEAAD